MADLRGELFIPMCVPTDWELLVKHYDLAEEQQNNNNNPP